MKPKIVVITKCSVILLITLFTSQYNGTSEADIQPKKQSQNNEPQTIDSQPDHLFYFVQVS